MTPHGRARRRGSTLLEVALAVALLAATGLGLVATQLALSRHGQSAATRGQAAFVADAFAEMAAERSAAVGAAEQWKARASALVPGGEVLADGAGGLTSRSTISWPADAYGVASAGAGATCPVAAVSPGRECVSLVYAR